MKFATKAIHAGQEPDTATGAIMTPVYFTSTYVQASPGDHKGFDYSRAGHPTRKALEECLAALENGKHGFTFSSGMGATDTVMKLLTPGDEVIATNDLYGGSYRLFTKTYEPFGIRFSFLPMTDWDFVASQVNSRTRVLWVETPTNPLLNIVDIRKAAELARAKNLILVVDNTFASPYLQNPLDLGAHIVMHSMTKYLGGHSDLVMGGLVTNDDALAEKIFFNQKSTGAVPGPMDCFLALRGVKTLHLRMERHCANAIQVAHFLESHAAVDRVYYPGLASHTGHDIAATQMKAPGGMLSFTLKDHSLENTIRLLTRTHIFALAESLGGVESLASHPASMTHASIPKEEREKAGVTDSLIRLSVGVEDIADLLEDLENALK